LTVDPTTRVNRHAWEIASHKHLREYDELLAEARAGGAWDGRLPNSFSLLARRP
jgi:hypothetical protein